MPEGWVCLGSLVVRSVRISGRAGDLRVRWLIRTLGRCGWLQEVMESHQDLSTYLAYRKLGSGNGRQCSSKTGPVKDEYVAYYEYSIDLT